MTLAGGRDSGTRVLIHAVTMIYSHSIITSVEVVEGLLPEGGCAGGHECRRVVTKLPEVKRVMEKTMSWNVRTLKEVKEESASPERSEPHSILKAYLPYLSKAGRRADLSSVIMIDLTWSSHL